MFEDKERADLVAGISERILKEDRKLLDDILGDVRRFGLKRSIRQVRPHSSTSMAIVSTDGGNHAVKFDPFHIQLVRVVDSDGQTLALRSIAVTTDLDRLFADEMATLTTGEPSPVAVLIDDLRKATGRPIRGFSELCKSISVDAQRPDQTTGWVISYRDLWEWAVLYHRIVRADFAQATLVLRDGLLRTKLFANDYFRVIGDLLAHRFKVLREQRRKDVFLVGLAKSSSVIHMYRLAMHMEDVFPPGNPYFVHVPREMERQAYKFAEFSRGRERLNRNSDGLCAHRDPATGELVSEGVNRDAEGGNEDSKYVFGTLNLARFGSTTPDPIWAVDVFDDQSNEADRVMGHLLGDSVDGFPVSCYPLSLQRAHEAAKLTDLDVSVIQQAVMRGIRGVVGSDDVVDRLTLAGDVAGRRY